MLIGDIEADGLNPTRIHCLVIHDILLDTELIFTHENRDVFKEWVKHVRHRGWVFHNGLSYDLPVLNRLWGAGIDYKKVIDTHVVSRLKDYSAFSTHSLEEIGKFLGEFKGNYTGEWEYFNNEMLMYCKQDVKVTEKFYEYLKPFIMDSANKEALRLEHDTAWICNQMQTDGFKFNTKDAKAMLLEVTEEMNRLEEQFKVDYPPERVEDRRLKLRYTKDGTLHKQLLNTMADNDTEIVGDELVVYRTQEFNPNSSTQRIDKMWEAGWKPKEMTDGHKKYLRR